MKINNKDFTKWLEDYSEEHHGLEGWLENDLYLDEVELPEELMLTLIQKWLREEHNINIIIWRNKLTDGYRIDSIFFNDKEFDDYETEHEVYEQALKEGIQEAMKLLEQKNSPTI